MSVPFDPEAIRVLASILVDTGLTEIEISDKDSKLRVVKAPPTVTTGAYIAPPQAPAASTLQPAAVALVAPISDANHPGAVTSPMVGVVYLSAEPGQPPYVSVGQGVSVGQTLLLIEAMKTFNQIKATRAGTVTRILVQPGAPVEFGEPMLIIE